MKKCMIALSLLLGAASLWAQAPDSLWSETYGGSQVDYFTSGAKTADGGYILAGETYSSGAGGVDFWLVKTDANGDTVWSRTFGGPGADGGHSVVQTTDGGYAVLGYTLSFGAGNSDFWLVKTNADGDSLWSRPYGGIYYDEGRKAIAMADGGLLLIGGTGSYGHGGGNLDMWLIRTDADGIPIWNHTYGGGGPDIGAAVRHTSDGGFILAGQTQSYGGAIDGWILKTNANGDSLWSKTSGWPQIDVYSDVCQTFDGGYAVAGYRYPNSSAYNDARLIRMDADGDTLWSLDYGYPGATDDAFNWICQTPDSGFAIAGHVKTLRTGWCNEHCSAVLVRTNSSGGILWNREFTPAPHEKGFVGGVREGDGSYMLWGFAATYATGCTDGWLVKTEPEGVNPTSGYLTLINPGPPVWDYRLTWIAGAINCFEFTHTCGGTQGSVIADAAIAGWSVASEPERIVFTNESNPLSSGSLEIFRLTSSMECVGIVSWIVGGNSGYVDGPLPVELISFTATGGDRTVTLAWRTASETGSDYFEILRDSQAITQIPSAGNSAVERGYVFMDRELINGTVYTYALMSVDINGVRKELAAAEAAPRAQAVVMNCALYQNYPNPFNPITEIAFDLLNENVVNLTICNPAGQLVRTVLCDAPYTAGHYTVGFDASALPSGLYFYTIRIGTEFTATKKMVLVK